MADGLGRYNFIMGNKRRPKYNENSAIRSALRRTFSRSPIVKEILDENRRTSPRMKKDGTRHKVDAVEFQCALCSSWMPRKEIQVDHIEPVVPVETGFTDWNTFKERLFCDKSNLRCLCLTCHKQVTKEQRDKRKLHES